MAALPPAARPGPARPAAPAPAPAAGPASRQLEWDRNAGPRARRRQGSGPPSAVAATRGR